MQVFASIAGSDHLGQAIAGTELEHTEFGIWQERLALTEVAIRDIPTASQGMDPPPNMNSEKFLLRPEKYSPIPAINAKYRITTNQSMKLNMGL